MCITRDKHMTQYLSWSRSTGPCPDPKTSSGISAPGKYFSAAWLRLHIFTGLTSGYQLIEAREQSMKRVFIAQGAVAKFRKLRFVDVEPGFISLQAFFDSVDACVVACVGGGRQHFLRRDVFPQPDARTQQDAASERSRKYFR